jgi:hypothetical protein
MRLRVEEISEGPGPGEVVVAIRTSTGVEQVVVHKASIENGTIEVGFPIHQRQQTALVELPRESVTGRWRIWVPEASVS